MMKSGLAVSMRCQNSSLLTDIHRKFIATLLRQEALDWIGCMFLDVDSESSGVDGGVLCGDS